MRAQPSTLARPRRMTRRLFLCSAWGLGYEITIPGVWCFAWIWHPLLLASTLHGRSGLELGETRARRVLWPESRPETGRKRLVALRSFWSFRTTETRNRGGRTAQTGLGVVVLPVAASGAGDGDLSGRRGEGGLANVKVHDVPGQGRALFVVCACTFSHGTGGGWTFAEHNGQKEAFFPIAVSERELHSALSAFPEAAGFGLTRGVRLT